IFACRKCNVVSAYATAIEMLSDCGAANYSDRNQNAMTACARELQNAGDRIFEPDNVALAAMAPTQLLFLGSNLTRPLVRAIVFLRWIQFVGFKMSQQVSG